MVTYLGIENPSTPKQIRVEICGLKQSIKTAEELISRLDQAIAIAELQEEEMLNARLQEDGKGEDKESGEKEKNENTNQETQEGSEEGR